MYTKKLFFTLYHPQLNNGKKEVEYTSTSWKKEEWEEELKEWTTDNLRQLRLDLTLDHNSIVETELDRESKARFSHLSNSQVLQRGNNKKNWDDECYELARRGVKLKQHPTNPSKMLLAK